VTKNAGYFRQRGCGRTGRLASRRGFLGRLSVDIQGFGRSLSDLTLFMNQIPPISANLVNIDKKSLKTPFSELGCAERVDLRDLTRVRRMLQFQSAIVVRRFVNMKSKSIDGVRSVRARRLMCCV
jgi:hypothetical protein